MTTQIDSQIVDNKDNSYNSTTSVKSHNTEDLETPKNSETPETPDIIPMAEALKITGISPQHFYSLIYSRRIMAELIGDDWWPFRESVERYTQERDEFRAEINTGEGISTQETAKLTGLSSPHIIALLQKGKLVGRRVGSRWVVSKISAEEFIAKRRPQPALPKTLLVREAANLLGVTANAIRALLLEGRVKGVKGNKRWFVFDDSLREYAKRRYERASKVMEKVTQENG